MVERNLYRTNILAVPTKHVFQSPCPNIYLSQADFISVSNEMGASERPSDAAFRKVTSKIDSDKCSSFVVLGLCSMYSVRIITNP